MRIQISRRADPLNKIRKQAWLSLPAPAPFRAAGILLALAIPLILLGIGQGGVIDTDEAFYQSIALNMLAEGDFFELRSGNAIYVYDTFANAPLQYWARAAVASLLGKNMLSMRILSALSAVLCVLMTYRLVLYLGDRRAAFASGLILVTTFQFLYLHSARSGELEPTVCLLLVSCAYLFIRRIDDPSRSWMLHHLLVAALFNLKAPTVFLPLAGELLAFLFVSRARGHFKDWLKWGLYLLPIALLWHGYQALQYSEQIRGVFIAVLHQMSGDFAASPSGGFLGRLTYYGEKFLFGAFPYALLYPLAIVGMGQKVFATSQTGRDENDGIRTLLFYLFAILAFYLGISKVGPWYIVHAYPFLAALLGLYVASLAHRKTTGPWLLASLAIVASFLFWLQPEIEGYNPFSADAYAIPMATHWRYVPGLNPLLGVPVFGLLALGGLVIWKRRAASSFYEGLALAILVVFFGYALLRGLVPLAHIGHFSPIAALDAELKQRVAAGSAIPFPVDVPRTHPWVVNYYFYENFELRISPSEPSPAYRKPMEHVLLGWRPGREPAAMAPRR